MTAHKDSGLRCLVFHGEGGGQCISCTCGVTVRPKEWQAHLDAAEKEDARLKRLARLPEAEKAVIEAAKAMADHRTVANEHDMIDAVATSIIADNLHTAVATLRELEGEV